MDKRLKAFENLLNIMDDLREKCPWDKKQTFDSLSSLTIEEAYELTDAIQNKDMNGVKEEIGDIMLHMVFYAKMGHEIGEFNIEDSLNAICEKLVRRHPHIYGDVVVEDADEVKQNWEKIKMSEGKKSVLEGVPNALPAVIKAQRMQEKAAQVGFEWKNAKDVWLKVKEEMKEFEEANSSLSINEATEEFGDLLFSLINYARFNGIDSNLALDLTNRKFKARIEYMEKHTTKKLSEMSLEEMDSLWDEAKIQLAK
jgi:XTP/dITP diphosphohydrolase